MAELARLAIGMSAVSRPDITLQMSVDMLRNAFPRDELHVFAEPATPLETLPGTHIHCNWSRMGVCGNWVHCLNWMLHHTSAEHLLVVENDVRYCRGARRLLAGLLAAVDDYGFISLYTRYDPRRRNQQQDRWLKYSGRSMWRGAQAVCLRRQAAEEFLRNDRILDVTRDPDALDGQGGIDSLLGEVFRRYHCASWFHVPSLADHVGVKSSRAGCQVAAEHRGLDFDPDYHGPAESSQNVVQLRSSRTGGEVPDSAEAASSLQSGVFAGKSDSIRPCEPGPAVVTAPRGVLYCLSGLQYAARLVVSLYSLRQHYDGPVTVISASRDAQDACRKLAADARLDIQHLQCEQATVPRQGASLLFRPRLHHWTPFETTVYLDADTIVLGPLDELFDLPTSEHFVATQFTDWQTRGRRISRRIRSWQETHPEVVQTALKFGPAINAGVFAFSRNSSLIASWEDMCRSGRGNPRVDELALQLLLPQHPHVVLDGRFNWSARFGDPDRADVRVVHFHDDCHLTDQAERWTTAYRECMQQNAGNVRQWTPAGDEQLALFLCRPDTPIYRGNSTNTDLPSQELFRAD